MRKPDEQHQFDLLYLPHNVFEGDTYKYTLTGDDVTSRYKVAKALIHKKACEVAFMLETICKKDGVFKFSKVFQCNDGSEFKSDVRKFLERNNADIRKATTNTNSTTQSLWKPSRKT